MSHTDIKEPKKSVVSTRSISAFISLGALSMAWYREMKGECVTSKALLTETRVVWEWIKLLD